MSVIKKLFKIYREYDHKLLSEEQCFLSSTAPEIQGGNALINIISWSECFWYPGYTLKDKEKVVNISLSLVCSGSCEIREECRTTVLRQGDLAVYKRRNTEVIRTYGDEIFRKKVLIFNRTPFLSGLIDLLFHQDITFIHLTDVSMVEAAFDRIFMIFQKNQMNVELGVEVFRLLQLIHNQIVSTNYSSELLQAIRFIHAAPGMRISRETLAELCNMSISSLNRMFNNELSCSPGQYILKTRFEAARRYLLGMNIPIKQIAAECGFINSKHFSAEFHRYYGISPRECRNGVLPKSDA